MHNDLTNLLPSERQKALRRDYFLRLGVVIVLFMTILTLASMILLLPTYVLLVESSQTKEKHLASIESAVSSTNGTALSARLAALSSSTAILSALAHAPLMSATIRSMLTIPRPGVTLSGFVYTPIKGTISGTLAVSGTAVTRDALRNYQLSLQSAPFALSASLPVSAYAKDSNITFTITMTLAP